ncbi:DUF7331 family protein [Halorussus halophilus]|uniref:DUF7331 family protein n=1 Tax=Halorussus halophilus TaxID=2650975 RepID=UPI0017882D2C|nr:hypothetical protein [Halorussus halophilus]
MTTKYENSDRMQKFPTDERYASFSDEQGAVVIYDTQNNSAWIQSDDNVELAAMA